VDAVRAEYAAFFDKVDAVTYRYDFVDRGKLSGNTDADLARLTRDAKVIFDNKHLVIETPIGAERPSEIASDEDTKIRVPFWLLLTIYSDPTGIIFPIPSLPDDSPNTAFVERVKSAFYRDVAKLLDQVPVKKNKKRRWAERKAEIIEHLHETLAIESGKYESVRAALVADAPADAVCNLCGSKVSRHFLCSPIADLGANTGNFTDWHLGNIKSTCLLCAISNFKVPAALQPAYSLVQSKRLVYLAVTTPNVTPPPDGERDPRVRFDDTSATSRKSILPFFDAEIHPKLVVRSLESLVTLNLIGALFLHNSTRSKGTRDTKGQKRWLKPIPQSSPFAVVGELNGRARHEIPALLKSMYGALNRSVILADPMMKVDIEVPFSCLVCVVAATRNKHHELKFKPFMVSNKARTIPVVLRGFHFFDAASRDTVIQIQDLTLALGKKVKDSMKISALASSPDELLEVMVNKGGANIEKVLNQLELAAGSDPIDKYLERMQELIRKYPLVREIWR